jgi:CspA family cold shock protein
MPERGRIKWFNNRAGWGFIECPHGPDVYLRHDALTGDGYKCLRPGDVIEFTLRKGPRGPYAADAVLVPETLPLEAPLPIPRAKVS